MASTGQQVTRGMEGTKPGMQQPGYGQPSQGGQMQVQGQGQGQGGQQLGHWDPFSMLSDPFSSGSLWPSSFNSMFGDMLSFPRSLGAGFGELTQRAGTMLRLDVRENDSEFRISADVPGVNKDQIRVELDNNNVLHISASRRDEREERTEREGWTVHRVERSAGSGYRSLRLPPTVDASRISASVDSGVLHVTVPKQSTGSASGRRQIAIA